MGEWAVKSIVRNLSFVLLLALSMFTSTSYSRSIQVKGQQGSIQPVVEQLISDLMIEHDIPGMSVAISYNSRDYFYNFGVLDRDSGATVSEDTIFEVGSVSKLLTVTLATLAEQDGKISLNEPIGKYLNELTGTPLGNIPVFHLATHTAGGFPLQLPDYVDTKSSLSEYYRKWEPKYPVGTHRHYSNLSIGLLGLLVSEVNNNKFAELMERELFPDIGMTSTFINVPDQELGNYAWGHNRNGEKVRVNPALLADEAYGVKTSSSDLLKFLKLNAYSAFSSGRLASAVNSTHTGYFDTGFFQQALIWEKYEYPIDPCKLMSGNSYEMILEPAPVDKLKDRVSDDKAFALSKTGSTGGFGAYVLVIPHEKFAMLLLANKNYPIRDRVETAYKLAAEVLSFNSDFCE